MNYDFRILSFHTNKFLLIYFLSFAIIIFFGIWAAVALSETYILLMFLMIVLMIFVARRISIKSIRLTVASDFLEYGGVKVQLYSVNGYHHNDQGLFISTFDILYDDKKTLTIPCLKKKSNSEEFRKFMESFINQTYAVNPDARPMLYQEVHKKQMYILKPIIILGLVLVGLLDLYMLYALFAGGTLIWQILPLNIVFVYLVKYLK